MEKKTRITKLEHKDGTVLIDGKKYHLYFTNDEIKEDDWCLCFINNKYQIRQVNRLGHSKNIITTIGTSVNLLDCKKIIATTDTSLKVKYARTIKDVSPVTRITTFDTVVLEKSLPQPSQAFIEKYCKEGGIDEVLVEFIAEEIGIDDRQILYDYDNPILKVDSHNTITIHPIKNSWSREEVNEFRILADAIILSASDVLDENYDEDYNNYFNWIKENL